MRTCSEVTLREIDEEVRRILDEAIEKVRHILDVRRGALEALTKKLIEVESIDSLELKRIIEETSPGPLVVPGTEAALRLAAADPTDSSVTGKEKSG
jgi:cell division protease FtsH